MTQRFLNFIPFILKHENVYRNGKVVSEKVPGDNGGLTKYGIDKASHPDVDIENLTEAQALVIYYKEWCNGNCEEGYLPPIGECIFNCQINAGKGESRKLWSRTEAQDLIEKWASGNETLDACIFLDNQEAFYKSLVLQHPHDEKFLNGWLNRLQDLRIWLKLPLRAQPVNK